MDGRDAMLAIAMNGEPLPAQHGYPVRMVVPGLYGYVSATKWVTEIELTRWEDFDGYWMPRGWSKEGPVKTMARIDTAAAAATRRASSEIVDRRSGVGGPPWDVQTVAGASIDDGEGEWLDAELAGCRPTTRGGSGGTDGRSRPASTSVQARADRRRR